MRPYIRFFIILILFLISCSPKTNEATPSVSQRPKQETHQSLFPFKEGEKVIYDIKSMGVRAGEAVLTFHGVQKLHGKNFYLITFKASAVNFFDEEKIYADIETFYPLIVLRDLNIWGKKEKIKEEYDAQKGIIKITKNHGRKTTEQVIKKSGMIDNIYCFIYRYRKDGKFDPGDSLVIHLPTTDVTIDLVKLTKLKTANEIFDAYFMETVPPKYKVWFGTGEEKIPLRINGSVGISAASLTMRSYEEGKNL